MINISKYETIPEFFNSFMEIMDLKGAELANVLSVSATVVSSIKNGKEPASPKILKKLSELYELSLDQLMSLEQVPSQKALKNNKEAQVANSKAKSKDKSTSKNMERKVIPFNSNMESNATEMANDEQSKNEKNIQPSLPDMVRPDLRVLVSGLPLEEQEEINKNIEEIILSRVLSKTNRYTHKDLSLRIREVANKWMEIAKLPTYSTNQGDNSSGVLDVEMDGYLELSDASLFFTLKANNTHLTIKTRYQDRQHLENFLRLIPGFLTKNPSNEKLGPFPNIPICSMRVFNLSELARNMRIFFSNERVPLEKVQFEECNIEPYFNISKENK